MKDLSNYKPVIIYLSKITSSCHLVAYDKPVIIYLSKISSSCHLVAYDKKLFLFLTEKNRFWKIHHCIKNAQIWSLFWSVFSRIWTEYGPEKFRISTIFAHSSNLWLSLATNRALKHFHVGLLIGMIFGSSDTNKFRNISLLYCMHVFFVLIWRVIALYKNIQSN